MLARHIAIGLAKLLFGWGYAPQRKLSGHKAQPASNRRATGGEAVVVTTHAARFENLEPVLRGLSAASNRPIFLVINGDFPAGGFSPLKVSSFLHAVNDLPNVFPICLGDGRGMSFIWNTGIRLSGAESVLLLNDDLDLDLSRVGLFIDECFRRLNQADLVIANSSFAHFAVRRELMDKIGWFDEVLLGFGEEDGDFFWRCMAQDGVQVDTFEMPGVRNVSRVEGFEDVSHGTGKYSFLNREILNSVLYEPDQHAPMGIFESRKRRVRGVYNYYPGETLWRQLHYLNESSDSSAIVAACLDALQKLDNFDHQVASPD